MANEARAALRPTYPAGMSEPVLVRSQLGANVYPGANRSTPPPHRYTGDTSRSAARSAEVSSRAQPPSLVVEQSSRWNGSATIREASTSATVNGPRPA